MLTVGLVGILVAMVLFMYLVYKGHSIFWVAPLMGTLIAVTSSLNPVTAFADTFANGVAATIVQNWSIYMLGAILGTFIADCGAAVSIANAVVNLLIKKRTGYARTRAAMAGIVFLCVLLTLCGIPGTVVAFTLFPVYLIIFELADIPRKFLPAALLAGSGVMACPGAPVFYNVFVATVLKTGSTSALIPGVIAVVMIVIATYIMLTTLAVRAQKRGEHFDFGELQRPLQSEGEKLPNPIISVIPLLAVFISYAAFHLHIAASLTIGIVLALVLLGGYLMRAEDGRVIARTPKLSDLAPAKHSILYRFFKPTANCFSSGSVKGANALMTISFPAGISAVVASTAAFTFIVEWLGGFHINPLVLTAIIVCVIVAITSSPPAAVTLTVPIIASLFIAQGLVNPAAVHRVMAFALSTFETLPCNGLVLIVLGLGKCSHKESYLPICLESVLFTFIGTVFVTTALVLFPGLA